MVTLRTEAVACSPTTSSALPNNSTLSVNTIPSNLSFDQETLPEMDVLTSGSRMLSKQGWEELKPTIRHLYLDQNRTLKQLADYVYKHYRVKATKKQLTHRISAWGFEKNVKREERRAMIQGLSSDLKTASFEARSVRGRTLNKAKLERWMKQERMWPKDSEYGLASSNASVNSNSQVKAFVEKSPASDLVVKQDRPYFPFVETPPVQHGCGGIVFDWKVVDVVGSPAFGRLIGALTVETWGDVPFLDLATDTIQQEDPCGEETWSLCDIDVPKRGENEHSPESTDDLCSSSSWVSKQSKIVQRSPSVNASSSFRMNFTWSELCPFPLRASTSGGPIQEYFLPTTSVQWTESECTRKLGSLTSVEFHEITPLVASMTRIAYNFKQFSKFHLAEKWYRSIVTALQQRPYPRNYWLITACLEVIEMLHLQGRHTKAKLLHQNLHVKVLELLGQDHPLALKSRQQWKRTMRWLGKDGEEERECRELVQSRLSIQGMGHNDTMEALLSLGGLLRRQKRYQESEQLLGTVITICTRLDLVCSDPYADFAIKNAEDAFWGMSQLAQLYEAIGRVAQVERVVQEMERRFPNFVQPADPSSYQREHAEYHRLFARTRKRSGKLEDCQEMLRRLFQQQEESSWTGDPNVTRGLGEIAYDTGCLGEAISWFEKDYALLLENVGLGSESTRASCKRLGLSYAKLGRHDEAIEHFERMIERLNQANPESMRDLQGYIHEIHGWMREVDDMRLKDWDLHLREFENSLSDDTPTEDSSSDGSKTLETLAEFTQLEYSPIYSP